MPPFLALMMWLVALIALLWFDPAKDPKTSPALLVPLIWMFFLASRLPMQWLGIQGVTADASTIEEGNPVDRTVLLVLILLAVGILISRSFRWSDFFVRNIALVAFITFALVSVLWSDFPLVSFKRWYRDLGNYFIVLVVLSDAHPLEAFGTLLRRLAYLLLPLSVLLVKYYEGIGRIYTVWDGIAMYVGATTSKNMLGAICMVSGLYFFWDTLTRWPARKEPQTKRILLVNVAFIAMAIYLLNLASSATSSVCLILGSLIIVAARGGWAKRHPGFFKFLVPAIFVLYVIIAFGFDVNGQLAGAVGRDPTLTGRSDIWKLVLSMHTNPIVGVGYESFWLGSRLQPIWRIYGPINESHNGYLEIYLNLGFVGVFLIIAILLTSYRNICKQLTSANSRASLNVAFWAIVLFYNMTEAAFRGGLMWVILLLAGLAAPERVADYVPDVARFGNDSPEGRFIRPRLETVSPRR
jgi:exopolysaccharide production protein ExoQ